MIVKLFFGEAAFLVVFGGADKADAGSGFANWDEPKPAVADAENLDSRSTGADTVRPFSIDPVVPKGDVTQVAGLNNFDSHCPAHET